MTRTSVHEELAALMCEPPRDKKDILYAVSKIRKIIEHDNAKETLWELVFFCDWVLHTKMDRAAARKILGALDIRLGRATPGNFESIDPDGVVMDILSFQLFRNHLGEFLERNGLPTLWASDWFVWPRIAALYGELVIDTPLMMSRENYRFKYLRKIVITACKPSEAIIKANPGYKYSGLKWEFTLSDDRVFQMSHTFNLPEAR